MEHWEYSLPLSSSLVLFNFSFIFSLLSPPPISGFDRLYISIYFTFFLGFILELIVIISFISTCNTFGMSDYVNENGDASLEDMVSPSPSTLPPPLSSSPVIQQELPSLPPPPFVPSHGRCDVAPSGGGRLRAAPQTGLSEGFSPTTTLAFKKVMATLKANLGEVDSGIALGNGFGSSSGASPELALCSEPPSLTRSTLGSSVDESPVLPGQGAPNFVIPADEVGFSFWVFWGYFWGIFCFWVFFL